MTIAQAKLEPPDDSRFSLAAVELVDWRVGGVEPVSGEVVHLLAEAGAGGDVLIYVHGFNNIRDSHARCRASLRRD